MTTQTMQTQDGHNTKPAWTFEADPDTGIMRVASGTMAIVANGVIVGTLGPTGLTLAPGTSLVTSQQPEPFVVATTATGTESKQALAGDITLDAVNGHTGGYIAGVMGNAIIAQATNPTGSNVAGVVGKGTIQGTLSGATHPVAGVIGEGSGKAHAAVVGTVSDTDGSVGNPSAIGAVFKAEGQFANDYGTSTVEYGMDLQSDAHDVYTALAYTKAPIRLGSDVVIMFISGANPTNGVTGDNFAGVGSICIRTDTGTFFRNTGAITNPTWTSGL